MCSCGGCLIECECGGRCCEYCGCFNTIAQCAEDCPDDCMADHRGEE